MRIAVEKEDLGLEATRGEMDLLYRKRWVKHSERGKLSEKKTKGDEERRVGGARLSAEKKGR